MPKYVISISVIITIFLLGLIFWQTEKTLSETNSFDSKGSIVFSKTPLPAELSSSEEKALQKLIPETLRWFSIWEPSPSCYQSEYTPGSGFRYFGKVDKSFGALFKEFEGNYVNAKIDVQEYRIKVYILEMNTLIILERSEEFGIVPNVPERICTFSENIQTFKPTGFFLYRENKNGQMKPEKRALLEKIIAKVQEDACSNLYYDPDHPLKLTIPAFEPGNPEIYVLLKGKQSDYPDGKTIERINLKYLTFSEPEMIKTITLPNSVEFFQNIIEKQAETKMEFNCPKK
ncbi:MAG: hypothetical protein R2747_06145 [Pyrinomonadaceae bacterium]